MDDRGCRAPYAGLVNGRLAAWWRRWRDSTAHDVVSALVVTAVLLAGSYGEAHPNQPFDQVQNGYHAPNPPAAALLLVAAACLVLAGKRRYPIAVLGISTAAVIAYSALGNENGAVLLAPAIALFSVAQAVAVKRALVLAAGTLVALMAATAAGNPFGPIGGGFFLLPALIAAPLFGGIAIANRRAYVASIQQRAEDEARRRVDDERLRIARELHDIVAHTMATINVQAGVAEHVLGSNPAAAGDALHAIKVASKDGLRELRAILNVLRQADEGDPAQPVPGLAQLDALIAGACKAGLPTKLTRSGLPRELPAAVDLAAYRIVQESLTNVIKHAGPASATVGLCYDDAAIRIEIADNGRGVAPRPVGDGTGHGLIGMRERAASVGGTLQAGPGRGRGYLVTALLPADGGQAGEAAAEGAANGAASGGRS
jgi:signal transduction histidine kinase